MAIFVDAQTDAADLAELVNGNGEVTTRYGDNPKKSWLYMQGEFDTLITGLTTDGNDAIDDLNVFIDAAKVDIANDVTEVDNERISAIANIDNYLSAFDAYYQSAKGSLDDDVAAFTIDSDAALADFAQNSADAFNQFDVTLEQYKESRGFNNKGTFADGFTYELPNDVGTDASGNPWIYNGTLPFTVAAGATPTAPTYTQVTYGTAAQVSMNTSDTVQSFADSFALKIFQSPTGNGLTEIQTRTVDANEVYEVRETSDDSLAAIYSDAAGTIEIVQNGTDNKSGSDGVVEFYIADGDYYIEVGGVKSNFNTASRDKRLNSVEDLKAAFGLLAGDTISTKGYYSPLDGGATTYEINTDSDVDGYSSFAVIGGLYAHPYRKQNGLTSTQFGIMPDGVTNWEANEGNRVKALYAALNKGINVKFIRVGDNVLYKTGMNIYNFYAQKWTIEFDEGVEFGDILHIISSGTPIFDREVSTPTGTNPAITFSEPHGMGTERMCTFSGTGTSLDSGSYLVTPTGVTTATVEATVTGANTGVGTVSDTPIKNVTLKGTYTTYDRFGCINVDGLSYDRVVCKSNPSNHATGGSGGGVHIFTMCKNFDGKETIIENTQSQAQSANQHAAFACDGIGLENNKFGKVWVKDSRCNGVILQGEGYEIGQIIVDAYGGAPMTSVIPFVGQSDLHGVQSANRAHGVWVSRATGRIDHILVNQKYGFDGRSDAQKDVMLDRDFIRWDSPNLNSFVEEKRGISVGHIECLNPKNVAVDLGSYQQWCSPSIDKITLGVISDENLMVINDSLRLTRGLINVGFTRADIGKITIADAKEVAVVKNDVKYTVQQTPAMTRNPSISVGSIFTGNHAAKAIELHCTHDIGLIEFDKVVLKDSYFLEPSVVVGTRSTGSNIGTISARLTSGQINKSLLEYGASNSHVKSIDAFNFIANKSSNNAVIHIKNARYSTIGNFSVDSESLAASAGGIKFTGTYNVKTDNGHVERMNQGVIDGGGNGRLGATMCVSLNNTTATDLPTAVLVADIGNFQWTV